MIQQYLLTTKQRSMELSNMDVWWLIGRFDAFRPKGRGSNPALAAWANSSLTMLCITIASTPPRRESALLSLACIRKKGDIKDQLHWILIAREWFAQDPEWVAGVSEEKNWTPVNPGL